MPFYGINRLIALGRLGATGLMALGVLAERWRFGGRVFASFHTFFLIDFALTVLGFTFLLLVPKALDGGGREAR